MGREIIQFFPYAPAEMVRRPIFEIVFHPTVESPRSDSFRTLWERTNLISLEKADLFYFKGGVEDVEWKDAGTAHKYLKRYFKP
jgi:hypothetical protein